MKRNFKLNVAAAVMALAVPLSGCSGDAGPNADSKDDMSDSFQPTGEPTLQVKMMDPPADYNEVRGEGFTISAPGEFQQKRETNAGEPMLILEKPSGVEAYPQRVVVIRDVEPVSPAAEQSFALETAKAAPGGDDAEVERITMPVPEGQSAYLVTWTEKRAGDSGSTVSLTFWQLMHQVSDDLILNVVALTPTDEFETAEVSKILRTFTPDASE
ncbi:hypothetical protein [Nocardioides gilvus]|uniref:hypothetical protein n=1 Tax=Nocardioides gilvus TaxID=1735589 RepID=UPI000D748BA0|nr:hypothetical protein [Nocardioides gilvus]